MGGQSSFAYHVFQSFEFHVNELGYVLYLETAHVLDVLFGHHQIMVLGFRIQVRDDYDELVRVKFHVRIVHCQDQVVLRVVNWCHCDGLCRIPSEALSLVSPGQHSVRGTRTYPWPRPRHENRTRDVSSRERLARNAPKVVVLGRLCGRSGVRSQLHHARPGYRQGGTGAECNHTAYRNYVNNITLSAVVSSLRVLWMERRGETSYW